MNTENTAATDRRFQKNAMASFIQIGALMLLLMWCFRIVAPFLNLVMWAMIIAVAIYPAHVMLTAKLNGREKSSATIFVLLGMAVIIIPTYMTAESSISALSGVANNLHAGTLSISQPDASVKEWPLIGGKVYAGWSDAATNLEETLQKLQPQLAALSGSLLKFAGSTLFGVLGFIVSVIIAGVFLVSAQSGYRTALALSSSLIGESGEALTCRLKRFEVSPKGSWASQSFKRSFRLSD